MRQINKLNSDARQEAFLTGNAGQRIKMTLRFMPTLRLWIFGCTLGDFTIDGIPVLCSENMLRGYKNLIDFGIACWTRDGLDPRDITDFETGYAVMYLLNRDDIDAVEERLYVV